MFPAFHLVQSYIFTYADANWFGPNLQVQKENRPKKTATAKFSNSQVRSNAPNTQSTAEKNSGPSLHEILRCPSLQSSHYSRGSMVGQVEAIYAAFKLDHNVVKKEPGVSIRTA